jgi:ArsR family transcriptional regulator
MSADELQRIFKTLSDPTRVRLLSLLEREELAVQELMEVLGMAQSRVSRHLAILRDAGLVRDRRDGTYVFYHLELPEVGPWREVWQLVRRGLSKDTTADRDSAALSRALEARADRARSFFDAVGPEWDALRKVFDDDALRAHALARLVPSGLRVADIGTGTGILAIELSRLGLEVIAIDHSARMLEAARTKLAEAGDERIELRQGEASALPLGDAEVDAAFAHMVLHYLPSPGEAVAETARVVKPGGPVVVVDFVTHEHEWMRQELGVHWLGFETRDVQRWFNDAKLAEFRLATQAGLSADRDLPSTFIASGTLPR